MHIDRSQFLALTTMLATGCAAGRDIRQVTVVDLPPAPAIDAGLKADVPETRAAIPSRQVPPAAEGYPTDEGYPADEGMKLGTISLASPCGRTSPVATRSGCVDPSGKAMLGKPLDCKSPVQGRGTGAEFAAEKCFSYAQSMLPGVARRAQACLKTLGRSPDSCAVYRCGNDALFDTCVTPQANAACKRLKLPASECAAYLSGLNAKGMQSVESCARKASATPTLDELYSCVESL
jgi:hypothetical protein